MPRLKLLACLSTVQLHRARCALIHDRCLLQCAQSIANGELRAHCRSGAFSVRYSSDTGPRMQDAAKFLPSTTATAAVGNMGAAGATPTYSAATICAATSHHRAATIDSATTVVAASTAILIVWITVTAAIIAAPAIISGTTYNCASSNGSAAIRHASPIRGSSPIRSSSIGSASDCRATICAAT